MKRRDFIAAAAAIALPALGSSEAIAAPANNKKSPLPSRQRKNRRTRESLWPPRRKPTKPASPRHRCRRSQRAAGAPTTSRRASRSGDRPASPPVATACDVQRIPLAACARTYLAGQFRARRHLSRSCRRNGGVHCRMAGWRHPQLELVSKVETQDRHFDVTKKHCAPERGDILRRNLRSTELMPLNDKTRRSPSASSAGSRIRLPRARPSTTGWRACAARPRNASALRRWHRYAPATGQCHRP